MENSSGLIRTIHYVDFQNNQYESIVSLIEKVDKIESPVVRNSAIETKQVIEKSLEELNQVFLTIKRMDLNEYLPVLSDVMSKYGRLRYAVQYPECFGMLRGSLNASLYFLKVFDQLCFSIDDCSSLLELEQKLKSHSAFEVFDDFILKCSLSLLSNQNLSSEELFKIGYTFSWFSNAMQHTQPFRKDDHPDNIKRFQQVFALCEDLLKQAQSEKATIELSEMYYNGRSGFTESMEESHKWLDSVVEMNPTMNNKARVANRKFMDYYRKGDLETAVKYIEEAILCRESYPVKEQNRFLIANLHNNKSALLFKLQKIDEAEQEVLKALHIAEEFRGSRDSQTGKLKDSTYDNQYYGKYDLRMAEIKNAQGYKSVALMHIDRAQETFDHHKQDSEDDIKKCKELKAKVEGS